jgi:hypothetical protein
MDAFKLALIAAPLVAAGKPHAAALEEAQALHKAAAALLNQQAQKESREERARAHLWEPTEPIWADGTESGPLSFEELSKELGIKDQKALRKRFKAAGLEEVWPAVWAGKRKVVAEEVEALKAALFKARSRREKRKPAKKSKA